MKQVFRVLFFMKEKKPRKHSYRRIFEREKLRLEIFLIINKLIETSKNMALNVDAIFLYIYFYGAFISVLSILNFLTSILD